MQTNQPNAAQAAMLANGNARSLVLQQGFPMFQQIFAGQFQPDAQSVVNIPPQNVGLIKGFLVKATATITNPAAAPALNLTPLGPANLVQTFLFTDLQNYQRINTPGWHISMLNSVKKGRPFLSSTPSDSPMGFGSNWPVIRAPAQIAANSAGTVDMYYWVPLSYTDIDLTGAVYANVVNATMNLQLTLAKNAQVAVSNNADPTLAVYQAAGAVGAVTVTNVNVTVYQSYIDQLPMAQNGAPILPLVDLNTMYELKNTAFTALVANQDFPIPFSNFRHFMSTMLIFDNQTGGAYPTPGSDVNYFSLRTANYTDARKADPYTWAALTRQKVHTDMPEPLYYFDHRDKPIYTTQYGNINLVVNPSTVNTGAQILTGWEMLANVQNLINAGSLAA